MEYFKRKLVKDVKNTFKSTYDWLLNVNEKMYPFAYISAEIPSSIYVDK